jgi:N-acetylmuramic acid 6-phosphate etherase
MLSMEEAVRLMGSEDARALAAVEKARPGIVQAIGLITHALSHEGRLIYVGAGTSGRLGVLDAAECPPTFCSDPSQIVAIIAGGDQALRHSIENVEDDRAAGISALENLSVSQKDVVLGIAAGGTTPFVHGALIEAHDRLAKTIFLICTEPSHVQLPAGVPDLFIALDTGPEVLTGSTRLKAGTATKLVLNTLTTLSMVQIGKTYGNLMVDIDSTKNAKLTDRAARILMRITGLDRAGALELLEKAAGKVKLALVMHKKNCDIFTADSLVKSAHGHLRQIIG